jgi:hypothetical protein
MNKAVYLLKREQLPDLTDDQTRGAVQHIATAAGDFHRKCISTAYFVEKELDENYILW